MSLKGALREIVGNEAYSKLVKIKNRAAQTEQTLRIGRFDVAFPAGHLLPQISRNQPQRNLALGIAAGEVSRKHPQRPILDIGANVGDTAARIASHSSAPLVLVEPSDIYFDFLKRNAAAIPNPTTLHKSFVFSGSSSGTLVHSAGTAYLDTTASNGTEIVGKPLSDFGNPSLIKIDTDGFDFSIITANAGFLAAHKPALYFENSVYNKDNLAEANDIAALLASLGYAYFHVFSATGAHICSTSDAAVVQDLNTFLCASSMNGNAHNLFYYDVLCFAADDGDASNNVAAYFRNL